MRNLGVNNGVQSPSSANGASEHGSRDDEVGSSSERLAAGDRMRRRVLGDEHVNASRSDGSGFRGPLQDLVTEFCWGAIWTRPGLLPATRSLINIAMLTALGKGHELQLHVRGALNNGCTAEEIQEVLLQAAVYCGVPAALEATRHAEAVIQELTDTAK